MRTLRRLAAATVMASMVGLASASADPAYLSDVAKRYPKAYALWGATLPRSLTITPWMRRLDGVVSPVRTVTVDGQPWQFGTVCVPHDCGANMLGLLFSAQQDRVKAVATLTGNNEAPTVMVIGEMDARTMGCIKSFMNDPEAVRCP